MKTNSTLHRSDAGPRARRFLSDHAGLLALLLTLAAGRLAAAPVQLTASALNDVAPRWHPGGATIAYMKFDAGGNWQPGTVNINGTGEAFLATGVVVPGNNNALSWLGNSTTLLVAEANFFHELFAFNTSLAPFNRVATDGNDAAFTRKLFVPGGRNSSAIVSSRDGLTVVWRDSPNVGTPTTIRSATFASLTGQSTDAHGTIVVSSASPTIGARGMALTPSGGQLVISVPSGPGLDLFVYNTGGGLVAQLTFDGPTGALNLSPDVSPDGAVILFQRNPTGAAGGSDIFLMNVGGGGMTQVTATPGVDEGSPSWAPDGVQYAFQRLDGAQWNIYRDSVALAPEIAVQQPAGTDLVDGAGSIGFGSQDVGSTSAAKTFTITNSGTANLTGLAITKDGSHPGDFTVGALGATLAPGASTTFTVTLTPSALGARSAAIHLASDDADENPFDIALTGTGVDVTPPSITCPNNRIVACDTQWDFDTPTATDNSTNVNISIVSTVTNTAGFCANTFSATRTWVATDGSGNSNRCTQTVTVNDATSPMLSACPANITAEATGPAGAMVTYTAPTASDGCAPLSPVVTCNPISGSTFPLAVTTVTCSTADACGNSASCSFTVRVQDTTPPTAPAVTIGNVNLAIAPAVPLTITGEAGTAVTYTLMVGGSFVNGSGTMPGGGTFSTTVDVTGLDEGALTVSATLTDPSGNASAAGTASAMKDTVPPSITCPPNTTVQCDADVPPANFSGGSASDGGNPSPIVTHVSDVSSGSCPKIIVRTYRATDASGNTNDCAQTITVHDTTPPQSCVTVPANMVGWWPGDGHANDLVGPNHGTLRNGATFAAGKVGQAFEFNGANQFVEAPDSPLWDFGTGDFTIDFWVNFDSVRQLNSFVGHSEGPGPLRKWIFWLQNGLMSFHINEPGPIGNGGGLNIGLVPFSPTVNQWHHLAVTRSGSTFTFYFDGSPATATYANPVPNATAPLTLGQAEGQGFVDGRLDEVEILHRALTTAEVQGIYNAGSFGKCKPVVTNTAPGRCAQVVTYAVPAFSDNCSGSTIVCSPASGSSFLKGTTTVTCVVTDACGNAFTNSFTVTVNDTEAPAITCPPNVTVQCDGDVPPPDFTGGSVSDNCDPNPVVTHVGDSASGSCPKTITRTYRATDASGNTNDCAQTITVHDTTPPVLTCLPIGPFQCIADVPAPSFGGSIQADNCGPGQVTVVHIGDVTNGTCPTIITRTWRGTDTCGNTNDCAQVITVHDTMPPTITCPAAVAVQCFGDIPAANTGAVTASDNCGSVTKSHVGDTYATNGAVITVTRTYKATDACGLMATCTQTITVQDTTPPVLTVCPRNVQDGTWTTRAPMSLRLVGHAAAGVNGIVYVLGGWEPAATCTYLNTLRAYDPAINAWTTKAPVPTGRESVGVGVVNGRLYVAGGGTGCAVYTSALEAYDPPTDTWASKTPMAAPRRLHGAAVVNGILYVVGGYNNSGLRAAVEAYDPTTDTWSNKSPIPTPRTSLAVEALNGIIYAVGGTAGSGSLATVEAYDPVADTWTTKAPMPTARHSHGIGVVNGIPYAVGGYGNSGPPLMTVEAYNPVTDTWTSVASMPTGRGSLAVAQANGVLYALGGNVAGFPYLPTNEAFTPNGPIVTGTDPGQCTAVVNFPAPSATDNCPGVSAACTPPSGTAFPKGTTTVTCTATDAAGLTASCSFTVTVNDTEAPAITCPPAVTVQCDTDVPAANFAGGSASDNCGPTPTVTHVGDSASGSCPKTITRTYKATDACNNMNTCTQSITVQDTTPPAITCPASIWSTKAPMPHARSGAAAAAINGIVYVAGGHNGTRDDSALQAYDPVLNTWTVLAPMPGGRYLGNGAAVIDGKLYVAGGWTTSPGLPNNNLFVYDPAVNAWSSRNNMPTRSACGASGIIDGKLYVTTACNGFSGYRDFLHVYDPLSDSWTQLPSSPHVHSGPAGAVIDGKFYVAGGHDGVNVSATLDCYDPLANTWSTKTPMPTGRVEPTGAVRNGKLYVIGGVDFAGHFFNTVEVYDPSTDSWTTEAPIPTARNSLVAGIVNGVVYVVGGQNSSGLVSVNEAFTPTIISNTDPGACSAVVPYTATATDNCPGVSAACAPPSGTAFPKGTTTVTCTATDAAGLTATCSFTVTVNDTEAPAITCPPNVTVQCDGDVPPANFNGGSGSDNCDSNPAVTHIGDMDSGSCPKIIFRTWRATDASGNTNDCAQTITVHDITPPVIACPPNVVVQCEADVPPAVPIAVPATDNCGGSPVVMHVGDVTNGSCPKIVIRTYRATDVCGNTNDCAQTITVQDTTPPSITCPANQFVTTTNMAGDNVTFSASATDNCSPGPAVNCAPPSGSLFAPGNTTVTCTATDACGNTNACAFLVTVNRAPIARNNGMSTRENRPVSLLRSKLLANDSDPDGDPLTVSATSPASTNGGAVTLSATHVTYTPRPGFFGEDRFTYTVSDGRGGAATAEVVVFVADGAVPSLNQMAMVPKAGGGLLLRYAGIPGYTYTVERSTDLMTWTPAPGGTLVAPVHGILEYCDPAPPQPNAFYRTVTP